MSTGEDVKFLADAKPSNVSVRGKEKMGKLRRGLAQRRAKVGDGPLWVFRLSF